MIARFIQPSSECEMNRLEVVLTQESPEERLLLGAFIRYESNSFTVTVERLPDKQIASVTMHPSHAS